ncbi:hypothetical protein FB192DRAFT_1406592 [Mucor lusitanicus]|uniref:Uncharacterized protein n=2 Tax=Mucor circinelloides f. lusitanicus TaxID=29924 RepID=A0A162Q2A2_MUCCL|nr:hypothetical protein FB192DRAFT_1406592 [Mucor lusitanicus]OAC98269.1 hypothetical protein MUCCIDRAFT_115799 [Mucor lusitanicus CBS 277.49]
MSTQAQQNEKKINENVDKAAEQTKQELSKLRAEYEELKRTAKPKVQEAENFLTSPSAIGFYQGLVVGVFVVLGYAKYKGGLVV